MDDGWGGTTGNGMDSAYVAAAAAAAAAKAAGAATREPASISEEAAAGAGAGAGGPSSSSSAGGGGVDVREQFAGMPQAGAVVEYPLSQRVKDELMDGRSHGVGLLVGRNCDR